MHEEDLAKELANKFEDHCTRGEPQQIARMEDASDLKRSAPRHVAVPAFAACAHSSPHCGTSVHDSRIATEMSHTNACGPTHRGRGASILNRRLLDVVHADPRRSRRYERTYRLRWMGSKYTMSELMFC